MAKMSPLCHHTNFYPPYGIIRWSTNNQPIPVLETGNASFVPIQSTNKFTGARAPDLYNKLAIDLRINAEKPLHNVPLKKKNQNF